MRILCNLFLAFSILSSSISYWTPFKFLQSSFFAFPCLLFLLLLAFFQHQLKLSRLFILTTLYILLSAIIVSFASPSVELPFRFFVLFISFIIPSIFTYPRTSPCLLKLISQFPRIIILSSLPIALFIIAFQISIALGFFDPELFRQVLLYSDINLGTIYKHSYSPFYHIQLVGFYIPFPAFILSLVLIQNGKKFFIIPSLVLALSLLFSLNLSLLVGSLLALFAFLYPSINRLIFTRYSIILLLILLSSFLLGSSFFVIKISEEVFTPSLRVDMFNLLLSNVSRNPFVLLFGTGVGSTLSIVTRFRDYTGMYYYELMTLFVLLQLGFSGFLLLLSNYFSFVTLLFRHNFKALLFFASYLLGSLFNPYLFNSITPLYILSFVYLFYSSSHYSPKSSFNPTPL